MTHHTLAPFVQWLGHQIFTLETGVQFPYGVPLQLNTDGWVPERSKGSDCKSDGSAFEGSNPSPTTI